MSLSKKGSVARQGLCQMAQKAMLIFGLILACPMSNMRKHRVAETGETYALFELPLSSHNYICHG